MTDRELTPKEASGMNRAEKIRQVFLWEQVASKAKARAAAFRVELQAEANAEFEKHGTAPTWRLPEIVNAALPVSRTRAEVRDEEALAKWVSLHNPDEVEMRVRSSYVEALRKGASIEGESVVSKDGTVIPGMVVVPGGTPKSLTLTPEAEAKAVAAQAAEQVLSLVATSLHLPAAPDVEPDQEGDSDAT